MQVGVVAAGYADGLPLALSNRGYLLVHGKPCLVLGRVSMDYTTVSLEGINDVCCGDEVTCLGRQGDSVISVDDWAQIKATHAYDIICSFGTRVERRYLGGEL
jgi:alanine racemase